MPEMDPILGKQTGRGMVQCHSAHVTNSFSKCQCATYFISMLHSIHSTPLLYSAHFNAQFSNTVGHVTPPPRITRSISSGYALRPQDTHTVMTRMMGMFFSLPLRNTVFEVPFFSFSFRSFRSLCPAIALVADTYLTSPYWRSTWKLCRQSPTPFPPATPATRTASPAGSCAPTTPIFT